MLFVNLFFLLQSVILLTEGVFVADDIAAAAAVASAITSGASVAQSAAKAGSVSCTMEITNYSSRRWRQRC